MVIKAHESIGMHNIAETEGDHITIIRAHYA